MRLNSVNRGFAEKQQEKQSQPSMDGAQKKRLGLWGLAGLAVLVLLVGLAGRDPAPQVTVVAVTRENLNASISSNGKVEPIDPHVLRAQFATFVEKVVAVEGQAVKRGQLLAVLDATELRAQLAQRRAELLAAEDDLRAARAGGRAEEVAQLASDLRKAEAEVARLRRERQALERLLATQAATRDDLDLNQLALERAEASLRLYQQKKEELARRATLDLKRAGLDAERARNEVRALEEKVRSADVTAPADGTLYLLPVRVGQYVIVGDLVAELADLRRMRLRAFVDEPELGRVAQGQAVEITWDAAPGRSWTGRTEQIPKTVVARGARSVGEVVCSVENEKLELLPNINVNVRIRVGQRTGALVVPRAAVRGEGADRFVYVVEGDRLRKRPIRLGVAGTAMYEVLEGLAEGDRVAVSSEVVLRDGMEVRAVEQK